MIVLKFVSYFDETYRLISDVDECSEIVDACGTGEECVNEQGKYSCECASGYEKKNGACVKKGKLLMT